MESHQRKQIIFVLGLLAAISPFSIDMYLPAFESISKDLNVSMDRVSYSLSAYFAGICAGQMLMGPLLDRYGRKPILYIGLIGYLLASIGCSVSTSVEMLIVFRFFQALGGCVGMVAPNAIVRDLFPITESPKILSMLILILGVSPILAPTVGGIVVAHFNWNTIFLVLTGIVGLILFAVYKYLPESKGPNPEISLKPIPILKGFGSVLKERQYRVFAATSSIAASAVYTYLAGAPYIFMKLFGVSEQSFGWIFAVIAAGLITSSQLNRLVLKRRNSQQILRIALPTQTVIGVLLVAGTYFNILGLVGTIIALVLFLSCQGFTFPNAVSQAMAPFSKNAGSAAALLGAFQMLCGALTSSLVSLFFNGTAMPMVVIMTVASIISSSIILGFVKKKAAAASA